MDTYMLLGVVAFVALVYVVTRGKKKRESKTNTSAEKSGWYIGPLIRGKNHSVGMPERPTFVGKGWYFDFPTNPKNHVHYLQWFRPPSLVGKSQILVHYRVTGGPFIPQEYPDKPPRVGVMFQRKGDDWSAQGPMAAYRWFSRDGLTLTPGEHVMVCSLAPERWSDVYSNRDLAMFEAALADVDNIAILFGSQGGYGHGIYAQQPSRFELIRIELT